MRTIAAIVGVVAALAIIGWFFLSGREAPAPPAAQDTVAVAPQPAQPDPIRHPAPAAPELAADDGVAEPPPPLPPLGRAGDAELASRLAALLGDEQAERIGFADDLIRRIVVTIDNLPRERLPLRLRPVAPAPGQFEVSGDDERAVVTDANYARYEPLVRALADTPTATLVEFYAQHYPLFQEAYVELGYPEGYFNDRLVAVIDHLLAAPESDDPIAVTRPHVMYEFADPALEALSPGHKLMLRIGPDNSARLKSKLRELRAAVATAD